MKATVLSAKIAVVGVTAAAGLFAAGCSQLEQAVNRGGDTSCSDFVGQDANKQRVTVTKFLKEESKNDTEPAGAAIDATIIAINLLCGVQSNADVPIRQANLVGIFTPK